MSAFDFDGIDLDDPTTWPTGDDLDDLDTLEEGWTDDLYHVDAENRVKVWRSRLGVEDGATWAGEITLETRTGAGPWISARVYNPDDPTDYRDAWEVEP